MWPTFSTELRDVRAYGYLCSQLLTCASEVNRARDSLAGFVEQSDLWLARTFVEEDLRWLAAFERLFHAVLNDGVRLVVVPSMLHLAVLGPPATIKAHFEDSTGARVVTMG